MYRDRELVVAEFADPPVVPQQLADFGLLQIFNAGEMSNQRLDRGGQLWQLYFSPSRSTIAALSSARMSYCEPHGSGTPRSMSSRV